MSQHCIGMVWSSLLLASLSQGQTLPPILPLEARMRPVSHQIPVGQPVLVQFSFQNLGNEPVTLIVPGSEPDIPSPETGLPLEYVFNSGTSSALTLTTASGRRWDEPYGYRTPKQAPILILAPRAVVGVTLDLRDYYPTLRGAGEYRLTWTPFAGAMNSVTAVIQIGPQKQVEIITDHGALRIQLFYDDAPAHVANFLDLVENGFYTGKTFHRIVAGYLIQGGCPNGDGTGIRPDGKRIPAEINSRRHQKGTLSMALLGDDPHSGSCQFFISNTEQPDWDGRYTIFGRLAGEESYTTLGALMSVPVQENGRPVTPIVMRSVRAIDAPPDSATTSR